MDHRPAARILIAASLVLFSVITAEPRIAALERDPVEVRLVVTATDQRGRYVSGLAAQNLVVYEDGIRQEVSSLAPIGSEPVTMTLLIDASNSLEGSLLPVQETAIEIARRLRPGDSAEVLSFQSTIRRELPFTGDASRLEEAIRKIRQSGSTSLHNAVYVVLRDQARRLASAGPDAPRHLLVVLSDGRDTSSLLPLTELQESVGRSSSVLYAVAPDGEDRNRGHGLLRALARATGGRVLIPDYRLEPALTAERVWSDILHHQLLRYTSSNAARDGGFRRVEVSTGAAGVTIAAREGYVAARSR